MKTKRWRPKSNKRYWCIDSCGEVFQSRWSGEWYDEWRVHIGNVFRTRKEAEAARKRLLKNGI